MFRHRSKLYYLCLAAILMAAGIGLYWGWRVFWFLTDDAYIIFRYVSNSILGYGYVWNLPPFRPVEGYTSFLWVVLLDMTWRLTGIQPPESANSISLLFAYGTTFLSIAMLLKIKLRPELGRVRLLLMLLALVGILANRTYLAWASSGLETAMFNFLVTLWVFAGLFVSYSTRYWSFNLATISVLAALTRPDGLLLVAATILLIVLRGYARYRSDGWHPCLLVPLTPFLGLIAHFVWRKLYYGEWVPNTYAAKYISPWLESGLRYWLSFTLEYALWFWLLLALVFIVISAHRLFLYARAQSASQWGSTVLPATNEGSLIQVAVTGTLLMHFVYYTFIMGGDHFEYRVYSHSIALIFVSTIWLMNTLRFKALSAAVFLSLFVLSGLPIPWMHWSLTQSLVTRDETHLLIMPIASRFPGVVRPYIEVYDELQSWLIKRGVCIRHQEHKVFAIDLANLYPDREKGALLSPDVYPVLVDDGVGIISWRLPTTNIIDWLGLNDYVIAHNPIDPLRPRYMAHDRFPPVRYVECFQPNLKIVAHNKYVIAQRETDAEQIIRDCEERVWPPRTEFPQPAQENSDTNNLDLASVSPEVEAYLWGVWPADPSYLYFVPPTQKSIQPVDALQEAFRNYRGIGCMVLPSTSSSDGTNLPRYMFTLLPSQNRPPLFELQALFPWAKMVTEDRVAASFPYNLGYAVPIETPPSIAPSHPISATWANGVAFLGYDLSQDTYVAGETIYLTQYYRVSSAISDNQFSVFAHLLDEAISEPVLWGQDDGEPCKGLYPPGFWQSGVTMINKVAIALPDDIPSGEYILKTGIYNWQTGTRMHLVEPGDRDVLELAIIKIGDGG